MNGTPDTAPAADAPRVLVVSHLYPTPAVPWQCPWLEEQVAALARHARMSVLCPSQSVDRATTVTGERDVRVTCVPTLTPLGRGRAGLVGTTLRYRAALRRHLRDHAGEFDVLHAHFGFPDAVLVEQAGRSAGIPVVVTLHGDDAFHVAHMRGPVGNAVRTSLARADRVICVSEEMRRAVLAAVPEARTAVIENGYDDAVFRVGRDERLPVVLFVGRLETIKNVDVLLRAFAAASLPADATLLIAGTGSRRDALEALALELGIAPRVRFLGQQTREEVAELMRNARCLALPSASEGWGMVVAESLACGTPVVASRVGGVPEIVASEAAGLLVTPGDESALRIALQALFARTWDPAEVAAGSAARPWSVQAEKIAAVYREVASGTRHT